MTRARVVYGIRHGASIVSLLDRAFATRVPRGVRTLAVAGALTSLLAACGSSSKKTETSEGNVTRAVTATTHSATLAAVKTNGIFSTPGAFQLHKLRETGFSPQLQLTLPFEHYRKVVFTVRQGTEGNYMSNGKDGLEALTWR
jgi:hypothetical protein